MDGVPSAEDHYRVTILVRQIGPRNAVVFNRVFERLARQRVIQVSDNPRRCFHANFVTAVNNELLKFGELHIHHRVFGLIGVGCAQPSTSSTTLESTPEPKSSVSSVDDIGLGVVERRRKSSLTAGATIEEVKANYEKLKHDFSSSLVDSRCVLLGYDEAETSSSFSARETFRFASIEDSDQLETSVRELLRAIYFVLESKRMDLSFEKLDPPPCPVLPEEEKFRIGLENRSSKTYKRKCLGRARKQHADYAMLVGLPQLALDAYQAAIELLRTSNDLLWLAGACEGWACAAMLLRFDALSPSREGGGGGGMPRVASMTPERLKDAQLDKKTTANGTAEGEHLGVVISRHQRHRSDENAMIPIMNGGTGEEKKKTRLPWAAALRGERNKEKIECTAILEKFETALENYSKFSFAALVEYNCMMKAVSVFRRQRLYIQMEAFHRDHVGKYLDDSFTRLDHMTKALICNNSAALYKSISFSRKSSFFARLGVLFRLHISEGEQRTISDYRAVYPILYRTLIGYGINENVREIPLEKKIIGPIQMQIKALHEVYTAAMRAELSDAAIRHLCHLIQVFYEHMDRSLVDRLFDDLATLVRNKRTPPALNQRISVGLGNIILPSIQLTRFPTITRPELCALPPHLAPVVIKASDGQLPIFIYSPFQTKKANNGSSWVVDCPGELSVFVYNCRRVELTVSELCLLTDSSSFDAVPVRLVLPPASDVTEPACIKLIGVPRCPGKLTITGYSCEVLGLKNVCKLEAAHGPLTVDVLPRLAVLKLECSLPRAPIEEEEQEPSAETTVYSGQMFEHSLTVTNTSEIAIKKARLQIWQPKVSGGPSMLEFVSSKNAATEVSSTEGGDRIFELAPGQSTEIPFRIFGIDPTATADDDSDDKVVETTLPLPSSSASLSESADLPDGQHDLIPYTGRLLTSQFVVQYESDVATPDGEIFERTARLPLAVCIVPALTVSAWHVLPGDGPFSRYIVVDVTNSTEHDAELVYSTTRRMNVLPRETCRVPLLSPCCSDVAGRAFYAATQKDSHMMQRMEVEKLRRTLEGHVARHLDIRWTIPAMELDGIVPVGALLSSVSLLKQLVLPAISLDVSVNDVAYVSEDDISVGIGEMVTLRVNIISSLDYDFAGHISLDCYQEVSSDHEKVPRNENLLVVGPKTLPFLVPKCENHSPQPSPRCQLVFRLLFRVEGHHKLRPLICARDARDVLFDDEVFVSPIGFSVSTKAAH